MAEVAILTGGGHPSRCREEVSAFLRSREGLHWLAILVIAVAVAAAAAFGFHAASVRAFVADKTAEKGTALQLVDAFVDNYSDLRAQLGTGDGPVPSTFRAHSIELFNRMRDGNDALRMRWIGRKGRSIATPPSDAQMAATIESFVGQPEPRPFSQFLTVNGEQVFRTVYPSIAREQSCVDCHNAIQPTQHWQLNDVMGAFSLDAPVQGFLDLLRIKCLGIGIAIFALIGGIGLWISLIHHRRIVSLTASQAALRESEERLRQAQRIGHMGSFYRNLLTDEAEWSDEMYRIFGVSDETMVPSLVDLMEMVHPEDRAAMLPDFDRLKSGAAMPAQQYRIIRPDGSRRYIYREAEIVPDPNGVLSVLSGTILDVTEFHEAQMRATELEQQLAQSQKMEAIGKLTGGMAHDFNNLLGVIIGNLDLLRAVRKDDAADDLVRDALDAAIRGADLTRSLLAFSRQQPLQTRRVDVNRLISDITRLLSRTLGERITIVQDLAAGVWPIEVDPVQLESSLANLATNARDAMGNGGRLVFSTANCRLDDNYVAQHPGAAAGDFVVIDVTDTGCGMPPDVVARIFEPFYTTKEFGKGTGLGLSMVFGFISQSGGHIEVDSEPGRGTRFRLHLPRATGNILVADGDPPAELATGHGETVLVVEDNRFLRRVVVRQLTEAGYCVAEADNARAGLAVLDRQEINLLFTDIIMPGGIDGVELARQVSISRPNLRVVLTSGYSESGFNGDVESLLPGTRVLRKPYRKADLAATVRAALDADVSYTHPPEDNPCEGPMRGTRTSYCRPLRGSAL